MIYRQVSRNCKEGFFIMLERKYEFLTKINCRGNEREKIVILRIIIRLQSKPYISIGGVYFIRVQSKS